MSPNQVVSILLTYVSFLADIAYLAERRIYPPVLETRTRGGTPSFGLSSMGVPWFTWFVLPVIASLICDES